MLSIPVFLIATAVILAVVLSVRFLANRHYRRQRAIRLAIMTNHPVGQRFRS